MLRLSFRSKGGRRSGLRVIATSVLLVVGSIAHAQTAGPDAGVLVDAAEPPPDSAAAVPVDDAGIPADGAVPVESAPEPQPPIDLEPGADLQTGIRGRIGGGPDGKPLPLAPVLIEGEGGRRTAISDETGAYETHVPPGRYTLRSYYDMFHGARIDNVRVRRGELAEVNFLLDPIDAEAEIAVEELEVPYRADTTSAAAQDQLRQEASGIGEGMGAQQMSKTGAGDAEAAAKRVVGVTIDDSQLVIRGLGGRYTRVLINGDPVPSTDPDRPGVDLDLFPTSVIDSLTIHKVFLPNLPGDFAGGVLDLSLVRYPRAFMLEVGAGAGFNNEWTFADRGTYEGGKYDFLGFDDGTRALPDSVPNDEPLVWNRSARASATGSFREEEQVIEIGRDFNNIWAVNPTTAWPKIGVDATVGDSFDLSRSTRFGYMATAVYDHNEGGVRGNNAEVNYGGEDGEDSLTPKDSLSGKEEVLLTALGTAGLDLGVDHSLSLLTMFNHSMEDEAKYVTGLDISTGDLFEQWQLQFVTRRLWFNQLQGDHRNLLGERLRLRWSGYFGIGERDEPDRRTLQYGGRGSLYRWDQKAGSGERFYSELDQIDVGGRVSLRFPLWPAGWATVGGATRHSAREFGIRRFLMLERSVMDATVFTAPPEELFGEDGLGTITRLEEQTATESYDADQLLFAGFAEIETPIVGPLSAAGGARIESFKQELVPIGFFEDAEEVKDDGRPILDRTDTDVLPGAALKYALTDNMFLRSAYALTLGRAQLRELAPYTYYDFYRNREVTGNLGLKRTKIHNVDVRWEWFFDEAQVIAVSGFYKRFIDPIELQVRNVNNKASQYLNSKGARSFGTEIELRINLGYLSDVVKNFDFETNLALIYSRIELSELGAQVGRAERRMYGQAPYALNVGLHYFEPHVELRSGLVYNVVGPRITEVGIRSNDIIWEDEEEQPFHSLDWINSWQMSEHFKLKLKVKNILFQDKVRKQGPYTVQVRTPGTEASIGITYEH